MEVCDAVALNCYVCHPIELDYALSMNVAAGLTPASTPYLWITDKFGKQYKDHITINGDGSFDILVSNYPDDFFNQGGSFDLFLSQNTDGTGVVNMTLSTAPYTTGVFACIILSINFSNGCPTPPPATDCDKLINQIGDYLIDTCILPSIDFKDPNAYNNLTDQQQVDLINLLCQSGKMTADFEADQVQVEFGTPINFTDLTDKLPNYWSWRFGDGTFSILQNPSKTYMNLGTYDVALLAGREDKLGDVEKKLAYIKIVGVSPSPYLQNWYDSLITKPSNQLLLDLNILFNGIYADGDAQEMDLFHTVSGLETDEQRLRPIISTSGNDFLNINGAILSNGGVIGDGATSFIDLNWIAAVHGIKYTQNSACRGLYSRTDSLSLNNDEGVVEVLSNKFNQLYLKYTDGRFYYRINMGSDLPGNAVTDSLGFHSAVRNNAIQSESFYRGISQGVDATNSFGLNTKSEYICGSNVDGIFTQPSVRQLSFPLRGSKLVNQLRVNNRIQTFMTARGINV